MNKKWIFISITSGVFIAFMLAITLYFLTPVKTKQNLKLPSSNAQEIIIFLKQKNYSVNFLDRVFLKSLTKPLKGWIYISKKELPRYKFLKEISSYSNHYTPITIIPGETTHFVLLNLAKKLNMNIDKLKTNYAIMKKYKEGNFLANTYNIPIYFKEADTIKYLINNSFKSYKKISKKYLNNFDLKVWKKVITIASILEKEAANKKEMPIISSVIYNRINKKMRLQMDGTLNYGIYSHTKVTHFQIKNDKSSYNTYKHKGLPKEPVCNVSSTSIIAALMPSKTNYLYFMKSSSKGHNFSTEYKTHIENIKKRKASLKGEH